MSEPRIAATDRGLLFGDGVFDTTVIIEGQPLAGMAHQERLLRHAAALGIDLPIVRLELAQTAATREAGRNPAILRTTVTRGVAARGLWPTSAVEPTLLTSLSPFDPGLVGVPARLITASVPRNERSLLSRIKSLNYLDNVLAAREAAAAGADDALILNTNGDVACSTIANVFALFGRRFATPPLVDGAMDGVVRSYILAAPPAGYEAEEATLAPIDLVRADGLFLTNSVRLLRPVVGLDGRSFAPHPIARTLLEGLLRDLSEGRNFSHLLPGTRPS